MVPKEFHALVQSRAATIRGLAVEKVGDPESVEKKINEHVTELSKSWEQLSLIPIALPVSAWGGGLHTKATPFYNAMDNYFSVIEGCFVLDGTAAEVKEVVLTKIELIMQGILECEQLQQAIAESSPSSEALQKSELPRAAEKVTIAIEALNKLAYTNRSYCMKTYFHNLRPLLDAAREWKEENTVVPESEKHDHHTVITEIITTYNKGVAELCNVYILYTGGDSDCIQFVDNLKKLSPVLDSFVMEAEEMVLEACNCEFDDLYEKTELLIDSIPNVDNAKESIIKLRQEIVEDLESLLKSMKVKHMNIV